MDGTDGDLVERAEYAGYPDYPELQQRIDSGHHPKVVAVGVRPGTDERKTGVPFVGKPGMEVRNWLVQEAFLDAHEVYLTNSIICAPPEHQQTAKLWIDNCYDRLDELLDLIKPVMVLAMGTPAAQRLGFPTSNTKAFNEAHGLHVVDYKGHMVISSRFPSQWQHFQGIEQRLMREEIRKIGARVRKAYEYLRQQSGR